MSFFVRSGSDFGQQETAVSNSDDLALDPEIAAIATVHQALKGLEPEATLRVLEYVVRKLGLSKKPAWNPTPEATTQSRDTIPVEIENAADSGEEDDGDGDLDGVSPPARRWMTRNQLTTTQLTNLFSLGADEIDVVAKKIPGRSKREKMRSVILLKAMAGYMSSGAARVGYEEVKEAAIHYDAYDVAHFAEFLKSMASEISGTKEGGYSLTTRGQTAATELIKAMAAETAG